MEDPTELTPEARYLSRLRATLGDAYRLTPDQLHEARCRLARDLESNDPLELDDKLVRLLGEPPRFVEANIEPPDWAKNLSHPELVALVLDAYIRKRERQEVIEYIKSSIGPSRSRVAIPHWAREGPTHVRWTDVAVIGGLVLIAVLLVLLLLKPLQPSGVVPRSESTKANSGSIDESKVTLTLASDPKRLVRPAIAASFLTFLCVAGILAGVAFYMGDRKTAGILTVLASGTVLGVKEFTILDKLIGELKVPLQGEISIGGGGLQMIPVCEVGPFHEASHDLDRPDTQKAAAPGDTIGRCRDNLAATIKDHDVSFVTVIGQTDRRELGLTPRSTYGSNSGLARNRAEQVKRSILDGLGSPDAVKDKFVVLTTGALQIETHDDAKLGLDRHVSVVAYCTRKPRLWIAREATSKSADPR